MSEDSWIQSVDFFVVKIFLDETFDLIESKDIYEVQLTSASDYSYHVPRLFNAFNVVLDKA